MGLAIVILGDRSLSSGRRGGVLWRTPFAGWGVEHAFEVTEACRPNRWVVIDETISMTIGIGRCASDGLDPGGVFRLSVERSGFC